MEFDIYMLIMGFFNKSIEGFFTGLLNAVQKFISIKILLNTVGIFVIITFAIKKLQEGDLFTWKNAIGVILMITYLGVFNLSVSNPTGFMDFFYSLITYPANTLSDEISSQTTTLLQQNISGMSPVGYVINKTLKTSTEIFTRLLISAGGMSFFSSGSIIKGDVFAMILAGLLVALAFIYVGVLLLVIIVAEFQLLIWKSLALIIMILLFIPQTRGMAGAYVKFLIGLSFYKPFVLVLGFLVFSVLDYALTNLPQREAYLEMKTAEIALEVYPMLIAGLLGIFISTALIKGVPSFINQVIGATGSVGMGIASAGQTAMAKTTGLTAGATAGAIAGNLKSNYQSAGGGIGGIGSALAGLATGGANTAMRKAISGGAKVMGKENSGSLGKFVNDAMNKSSSGRGINDVVSKGISTSVNTAKNLGQKAMGKK